MHYMAYRGRRVSKRMSSSCGPCHRPHLKLQMFLPAAMGKANAEECPERGPTSWPEGHVLKSESSKESKSEDLKNGEGNIALFSSEVPENSLIAKAKFSYSFPLSVSLLSHL